MRFSLHTNFIFKIQQPTKSAYLRRDYQFTHRATGSMSEVLLMYVFSMVGYQLFSQDF